MRTVLALILGCVLLARWRLRPQEPHPPRALLGRRHDFQLLVDVPGDVGLLVLVGREPEQAAAPVLDQHRARQGHRFLRGRQAPRALREIPERGVTRAPRVYRGCQETPVYKATWEIPEQRVTKVTKETRVFREPKATRVPQAPREIPERGVTPDQMVGRAWQVSPADPAHPDRKVTPVRPARKVPQAYLGRKVTLEQQARRVRQVLKVRKVPEDQLEFRDHKGLRARPVHPDSAGRRGRRVHPDFQVCNVWPALR